MVPRRGAWQATFRLLVMLQCKEPNLNFALMNTPAEGTAAGTLLGEVPGGAGPSSPRAAAAPGPVLPSAEAGEMQVGPQLRCAACCQHWS